MGHFTEALARTPPDNREAVLLAMWNLATVHHANRDHESAVRKFDEMLSECRARDYGPGEALAHLGLCAAHRALGNLDESLSHGRNGLNLGRRLKMHRVECEVLNALGETSLAAQDIDHAEKVFAQASETANDYSFARYRARALDGFAHVALWDADHEWVEMRLRARWPMRVTIADLDLVVDFTAGEEIRTEISAKFRRDGIERELADAGFALDHWWTDRAGRFALSLARAVAAPS